MFQRLAKLLISSTISALMEVCSPLRFRFVNGILVFALVIFVDIVGNSCLLLSWRQWSSIESNMFLLFKILISLVLLCADERLTEPEVVCLGVLSTSEYTQPKGSLELIIFVSNRKDFQGTWYVNITQWKEDGLVNISKADSICMPCQTNGFGLAQCGQVAFISRLWLMC